MPYNAETYFRQEGLHPKTPLPHGPSPPPVKLLWSSETAKTEKKQGAWTFIRNPVTLNKNCIYRVPKS